MSGACFIVGAVLAYLMVSDLTPGDSWIVRVEENATTMSDSLRRASELNASVRLP